MTNNTENPAVSRDERDYLVERVISSSVSEDFGHIPGVTTPPYCELIDRPRCIRCQATVRDHREEN